MTKFKWFHNFVQYFSACCLENQRLQAVQQEKKRAEGLFLHIMGANSSITNKNRDLTKEQRTHTGINSIDLQ